MANEHIGLVKAMAASASSYMFCAVLAFGYAYNHVELNPSMKPQNAEDARVCKAILCSMFWPFYVSVLVFEKEDK